jgi:hypothetical protein
LHRSVMKTPQSTSTLHSFLSTNIIWFGRFSS